jgi:hypothetical protein
MLRVLSIALGVIAGIHGLIHLLGFIAYWPLANIPELPYKTTLFGGRLDLGTAGTRAYSLLWLLAALGFVSAAIALLLGRSFWAPLMLSSVLLSLVICILDWQGAFRGALIDVVLLLILGVVFGLRVQPASFPVYAAPSTPVQTVQLPTGLPKPVERFYRMTYGDHVPVYHSAVLTGRGTLRLKGITFPARSRLTYIAGEGYHHYFELSFYGQPVLKANEHYLGGHSRLVLPFIGVIENDSRVDSAANQGFWAEEVAFPAVFVTDPRVRWEPGDETTAQLHVPFGEGEQVFTVHFDPRTGRLTRLETPLRYRDAQSAPLRWWGEVLGTGHNGRAAATSLAANWADERSPWLVYEIEAATFNTDVSTYIRQTGP